MLKLNLKLPLLPKGLWLFKSTPENRSLWIFEKYTPLFNIIGLSWIILGCIKIDEIENTAPQILKNRNLLVNESKTEKYTVERNGSDQWKTCKYVGSLLDTQQDIKRRNSLANQSYISVKDIYRNKDISLDTKLRIYNALIESIFLYNCEVWTTTKKKRTRKRRFSKKSTKKNTQYQMVRQSLKWRIIWKNSSQKMVW